MGRVNLKESNGIRGFNCGGSDRCKAVRINRLFLKGSNVTVQDPQVFHSLLDEDLIVLLSQDITATLSSSINLDVFGNLERGKPTCNLNSTYFHTPVDRSLIPKNADPCHMRILSREDL